MKSNIWTHRNGDVCGINTPLSSPRGWLNRALDSRARDLTMEPGSLHALDITVGAIFPRGLALPDPGHMHTLYRYFTIPTDERLISGNRGSHDPAGQQRVIGMALTAPIPQISYWLYQLKQSGATWTWTCQDVNSQGQDMMIDQSQIYDMLDRGIGILDIAKRLNYSAGNVRVVYRKWRRETQPQKSPVRQPG